jgi:hypothetical protein
MYKCLNRHAVKTKFRCIAGKLGKTSKQKLQYESLLIILHIDIELCAVYQASRIQHVCFSNIPRSYITSCKHKREQKSIKVRSLPDILQDSG